MLAGLIRQMRMRFPGVLLCKDFVMDAETC